MKKKYWLVLGMALMLAVPATGCNKEDASSTTVSAEDDEPTTENVVKVLKAYGAIAEDAADTDYSVKINKCKISGDNDDKATVTCTLTTGTDYMVDNTYFEIIFKKKEEKGWTVSSSTINEKVKQVDHTITYVGAKDEDVVSQLALSSESFYVSGYGYASVSAMKNVSVVNNKLDDESKSYYVAEVSGVIEDGIYVIDADIKLSLGITSDYSSWKVDYISDVVSSNVTYQLTDLTEDEIKTVLKDEAIRVSSNDFYIYTSELTITAVNSQKLDNTNLYDDVELEAKYESTGRVYTLKLNVKLYYYISGTKWLIDSASISEASSDYAEITDKNYLTMNFDDDQTGIFFDNVDNVKFSNCDKYTVEGEGVNGSTALKFENRYLSDYSTGLLIAIPEKYYGHSFDVSFDSKCGERRTLPVYAYVVFYDGDLNIVYNSNNAVAVNANGEWSHAEGNVIVPLDSSNSYMAYIIIDVPAYDDDFYIDNLTITVSDKTYDTYADFEQEMKDREANASFVPADNSAIEANVKFEEAAKNFCDDLDDSVKYKYVFADINGDKNNEIICVGDDGYAYLLFNNTENNRIYYLKLNLDSDEEFYFMDGKFTKVTTTEDRIEFIVYEVDEVGNTDGIYEAIEDIDEDGSSYYSSETSDITKEEFEKEKKNMFDISKATKITKGLEGFENVADDITKLFDQLY